ncbi:MAG: recombinase RecT [Bacteroides sp.]|nr:recombinase RecT [Muribaculaceae bacterium]MCM1455485.1 recombinase RecT [Bacteroides sp.]
MANIQTTTQKSISDKNKKPKFSAYMSQDNIKNLVQQAVGKNAQSFTASIISAVSNNPQLQECTQNTILSGALLGESLKLSPSPQLGQYYLVPFAKKDKQGNILCYNAQFVLGAKGYKQLAMRSGQYKDLDVIEIKEGEYKGRDKFTGKQKFEFVENDDERDELPTIGYMAYFELLNGFKKTVYWTKQKMIKHANTYSAAFNADKYDDYINGRIPQKEMYKYSSFWYKNFDEMAFKTMLRYLISQWGIMSIEMQSAIDADNSVILNENGEKSYVEIEDDVETVEAQVQPQGDDAAEPTEAEQSEFDFFNDADDGQG